LYWLKHGQVGRIAEAGLGGDVVYSIAGDGSELWVGRQQGGLTRLRFSGNSVTASTYTQSDGLAENSVYAVYRSQDGSVWAGTLSGGLSEYRNGRFTTYTTANGMASNTVSALSNGRLQAFGVRDGLPSADLYCLLADSAGTLWIGSGAGLAYFSSNKVQVPLQLPDALHEQIFGIAEDRAGWFWIATSNHVLRVKRADLLSGSASKGGEREYGMEDGLHGLEGVKRYQSVVADALGR